MEQYRTLVLRSTRSLGSALVQLHLIKEDELENAYQKLIDIVKNGDLRQACLLKILMHEMKAFDEGELLKASPFPLIPLQPFTIPQPSSLEIDIDLCYATWTLPFDKIEDVYFLTTAYYLSEPTIEHWKKLIPGHIIWHATELGFLSYALDEMSQKESEENKVTYPITYEEKYTFTR